MEYCLHAVGGGSMRGMNIVSEIKLSFSHFTPWAHLKIILSSELWSILGNLLYNNNNLACFSRQCSFLRASKDDIGHIVGVYFCRWQNWRCSKCSWQSLISNRRCKYRNLVLILNYLYPAHGGCWRVCVKWVNEKLLLLLLLLLFILALEPTLSRAFMSLCACTGTHPCQRVLRMCLHAWFMLVVWEKSLLLIELFLVDVMLGITPSSASHVQTRVAGTPWSQC